MADFDFAAAESRRVKAQIDAIRAMENASDAASLLLLANAFGDFNIEVKEAALQALDERMGEKATQFIRLGLNDGDAEFRLQVLTTLAQRGDLDSLLKARWDANDMIKDKAAELLAQGGW